MVRRFGNLIVSFLLATSSAILPAQPSKFDARVAVTVRNEPLVSTTVKFHNNHSVPITAAMVFLRRFDDTGRARMNGARFHDSLIVNIQEPILPGKELVMDFGRELIPNARPDEIIPRVVIFEDGTWSGDGDYVERILERRRAARNALAELIRLGDSFNRDHTDLKTAIAVAQKFISEKEQTAANWDDQSAIVTAIGGLAEDMRINFQPGKPVFWIGDIYTEMKRKLDESKPPL